VVAGRPLRRTLAAGALAGLAAGLAAGCAGVGPAALARGRPAYNTVINATEDQQVLSMIVRRRYGETFGMLAVASVTASLRTGAAFGGNVGIGPNSAYDGNLVPFSAELMIEDNPTIAYVPMRGEQFLQRMLAPVSAEQALLLERMSSAEVEVLRMLVRRVNGIVNPAFASQPVGPPPGFERFLALYGRLRERGRLDVVRSGEEYQLLLHDFADEEARDVDELLATLGIRTRRTGREAIALPLRFLVGAPRADAVDLETPSALEVIEAAGAGVAVPEAHLAEGLARAPAAGGFGLLAIHSSRERPRQASVAVRHRGWWFFVDAGDLRSKEAFLVLRTLIGLRLDQASAGPAVPVLTIPVAR
jgi:hypothetical protein